jgi:hypothetical protein
MTRSRFRFHVFIVVGLSALFCSPSFGEPKLTASKTSNTGFGVFRLIVWCYERGETSDTRTSGMTEEDIEPRTFGKPRTLRMTEEGINPRLTFPCSQLVKKRDGKLHYIPAIGTITSWDYSDAKARILEQLRQFVCSRMWTALLLGDTLSNKPCPIGEQKLADWLFMDVTGDPTKAVPTVEVEVYGKSGYLAIPRDKYWERYRFSFQAVDKSASETNLIVAIDEAKEEKNGDNIKMIPIRSPIGDDHRKEVETLFNRITSVMFATDLPP